MSLKITKLMCRKLIVKTYISVRLFKPVKVLFDNEPMIL